MKRHMDIGLLDDIIRALSRGEKLPEKNKDHELTGDWVGHRECHIQPDWLLIYRIEDDVLVLTLDEPSVSRAGGGESRTAGATAAPVAGELIRRVAPLLGLRPLTESQLPMVERPVPDRLKLVSN